MNKKGMHIEKVNQKVNMVGIGGQKCASTWIYKWLLRHPDFTGTASIGDKEVNYFSSHYSYGHSWYHRQINTNGLVSGEFSVNYMNNKEVIDRIHRYNDDIKIILSVRNPVDRAVSQHKHEIRRGRVKGRAMNDINRAMKNNPTYVSHGLYGKWYTRWEKAFSESNILVVKFDNIVSEPSRIINRIYNFLGLREIKLDTEVGNKENESRQRKYIFLTKTRRIISKAIRFVAGNKTARRLSSWRVVRSLKELNRKKSFGNVNLTIKNKQAYERWLRDIKMLERKTDLCFEGWCDKIKKKLSYEA